MPPHMRATTTRAALLGLAVGDALGVPVEFIGREVRRRDIEDLAQRLVAASR